MRRTCVPLPVRSNNEALIHGVLPRRSRRSALLGANVSIRRYAHGMSETGSRAAYSWVNLWGQFDDAANEVIFRGYTFAPEVATAGDGATPQSQELQHPRGGVGRRVSNQHLTDGTVSLDIQFKEVDPFTTAEVILHHDPITDEMLTAGLGANGFLANVRYWTRAGSPECLQQQIGLN
jgi:hypothetical protein